MSRDGYIEKLNIIAKKFDYSPYKIDQICKRVQLHLNPAPGLLTIARLLQDLDNLDQEDRELANWISVCKPQYKLRETPAPLEEKSVSQKKVTRTDNPGDLQDPYWTELAKAMGKGISAADAMKFYYDIKLFLTIAKRTGKKTILKAVKQSRKTKGQVLIENVEIELRKIHYRYKSDPDSVHVISVPMGGKTSK